MDKLQIVYFYEEGKIYPFLKEKKNSNKDYYILKDIKKEITKEELLSLRINKYINLLKKGHNYQEIKDLLSSSIENLSSSKDFEGIDDIYEEKDALKVASNLLNIKKKKRNL